MMSRALAHSRHLRRLALQRSASEGNRVDTRTAGAFTVDGTPEGGAFFIAHDTGDETCIANLSELTSSAA